MAISRQVAQALKSVSELTEAERHEFVEKVNDLLSNDSSKKRILKEELANSFSITLGPAPGTCPRCGK